MTRAAHNEWKRTAAEDFELLKHHLDLPPDHDLSTQTGPLGRLFRRYVALLKCLEPLIAEDVCSKCHEQAELGECDACLRRWSARFELDKIDAELASWLVDDGALSEHPLGGSLSEWRRDLRKRRIAAVAKLEAADGRDWNPILLRLPTEAQREAVRIRNESLEARLRRELWLNHGHTQLYEGDDGQMLCGECAPRFDYKRLPIDSLQRQVDRVRYLRAKAILDPA